ncbi:MAG: hypothetical protein DF168_00431 [Candidatus Moanabacter tarae]|uniref:Uncharacterized protein n=1 Tax=Candidatus Moanibacter tarae TaxID=2200854 RepID=A0A2Z4AKM4_9BACT|nr:MAG: hypothetical protein DF168_00431 [Candidatus Moanabacter tarae]|tara:strand:- start:8799 stop:9374 length:576 start_codon:yes stop_codon:yes gene_type:complete
MVLDRTKYGARLRGFLEISDLPELRSGKSLGVPPKELSELSLNDIFNGIAVDDEEMALCCLSGVQLLHAELDSSHRICQSVKTTTGSYWHGIVHRREGDFENSKYWFQKVGEHPIHADLARVAKRVAEKESGDLRFSFLCNQKMWDSAAFVDLCEDVTENCDQGNDSCCMIQMMEWELLFEYSYGKAIGND